MNRWDFKINDDFKIEASPNVDEMLKFVTEASKELQERIMEREEMLVLTEVSVSGLKRLIDLCRNELKRRANFKIKL